MVTRQLLSFTQRIAILMILCFQPTGVDNVTSTGSQCGISLGRNATVSCTFQTPLCSGPQTQAYQLEIIGSGCQESRRLLDIICYDGEPYCTPSGDEYGCVAKGHNLTLHSLFPCDAGTVVCENIGEKATISCSLTLSADEIKKSKRLSDSSTTEEESTPRTEISTLDRQDASSSSNPYMSAVIVLVILVVILVVILLVILIKAVISYRCLVKENRQLSVTINQLKKKIKHMEDQHILIVQAPSSNSARSHAIAIPGESKTRTPALEDKEKEVDGRGRHPSPDYSTDRRPDFRDPNAGAASTPSFPPSDLCAGDDSTCFVQADVHHTTAVEYVLITSQQQRQQNVEFVAASHGSTATPSRSGPTEEEIQLDEGDSDPLLGIVDVRHDDNTEQFKGQADRENSEEQAPDEVFRVV